MNPESLPPDALDVLKHYDVEMFTSWEELPRGILNVTYKLHTPLRTLILQRVNKHWDERIIDDYYVVQQYLKDKLPIPPLLPTIEGSLFVKRDRHIWRLLMFVDNDETPRVSADLVRKTGKMLARLHRALSDFQYIPKFSLDDFHNTPNIITKLRTTFNAGTEEKCTLADEEYRFITENVHLHYLPDGLPTTIIHADPKLSNFLYKDCEVITIIDWDTMMRASPLIDVADALRSWCKREDSTFDKMLYDAAIEGYCDEKEIDRVLAQRAFKLIVLELAARHLIDYFEESYFKWDKDNYSSSAEFNLARCKAQIKYYANIMEVLR